MSNLFKAGLPGIKNLTDNPFIIDYNSRVIENQPKIIRPADEQAEEDVAEEDVISDKEIIDDAMDMSKDILDKAREHAKNIIEDAKLAAEDIFENAKRDGFSKGYEEGRIEAESRNQIYLETVQSEKNAFIEKNNQIMYENIADTEKKIIDISCGLIEKLTGILVEHHKPVMLHMINNALGEIEASRNFIIRVSEQNYQYISDNMDRIVGATNPSVSIEIFADTKLKPHQCVIESENGIIDLSMDVQVRNLIAAIKLLSD